MKQSNLPLWTHISKIISCYLALLRKKILHENVNSKKEKILHENVNSKKEKILHENVNSKDPTATHVKQFLKERHNDMFNLKKYYSDKTKDDLITLILLKNRQLLKADDEIERLNKVKKLLQKKCKRNKEFDDWMLKLP